MLSYFVALRSVAKDKSGIAAIEYALIASLVSVILIAVFPTIQTALQGAFTNVSTHLTTGK